MISVAKSRASPLSSGMNSTVQSQSSRNSLSLHHRYMKNDSRLPTPMFCYAQATNTRALALVGDADANAYELLFSFASSEGKEQFLHLVRTNEDMGNDYIENDFMSPTAEEIRDARPLGTVLPLDLVNHVALIAATLFACREDSRSAS